MEVQVALAFRFWRDRCNKAMESEPHCIMQVSGKWTSCVTGPLKMEICNITGVTKFTAMK